MNAPVKSGLLAPRLRVLILHQNFPGQFRGVASHLAAQPDIEVLGIGRDTAPGLTGIDWLRYRPSRMPGKQQHHYLLKMENAVLHGQAVARSLLDLKRKHWIPDVILAHPGWGETLYAKDVFPDTRLIHFCEWYYGAQGADVGFDPEFPVTFDDRARVRTWNALHTLNLESCDIGVSPTHWQHSRHPATYRGKIAVIHEGIDTDNLAPDSQACFVTPSGAMLKAGDPVMTYVARNLEPYRGFHSFMRAVEIVQRKHKNCHALIVGGNGVSYGSRPTDAPNWRERMLREVKLDASRTHFLGLLPNAAYRKVLQVSAAHVYLTYPFVLSWSMLEAMASGCLLIGSKTPPVEEVIRDGENGLLVDFFDSRSIADRMLEALESPQNFIQIRQRARTEVTERYSRGKGLDGYSSLVGRYENTVIPGLSQIEPEIQSLVEKCEVLNLSQEE